MHFHSIIHNLCEPLYFIFQNHFTLLKGSTIRFVSYREAWTKFMTREPIFIKISSPFVIISYYKNNQFYMKAFKLLLIKFKVNKILLKQTIILLI